MTTNAADRLNMPLGEAIFTLRAIRRQKPDPHPGRRPAHSPRCRVTLSGITSTG